VPYGVKNARPGIEWQGSGAMLWYVVK